MCDLEHKEEEPIEEAHNMIVLLARHSSVSDSDACQIRSLGDE